MLIKEQHFHLYWLTFLLIGFLFGAPFGTVVEAESGEEQSESIFVDPEDYNGTAFPNFEQYVQKRKKLYNELLTDYCPCDVVIIPPSIFGTIKPLVFPIPVEVSNDDDENHGDVGAPEREKPDPEPSEGNRNPGRDFADQDKQKWVIIGGDEWRKIVAKEGWGYIRTPGGDVHGCSGSQKFPVVEKQKALEMERKTPMKNVRKIFRNWDYGSRNREKAIGEAGQKRASSFGIATGLPSAEVIPGAPGNYVRIKKCDQ